MRNIFRLTAVIATVSVWACGSPEQSSTKPAPPAQSSPSESNSTVPETIVLDTSEGRITLPHLAHARKFHCNTCHSEVNPGKIAWDKDTAHAYCRDCHKKNNKGPMTCTECHKK